MWRCSATPTGAGVRGVGTAATVFNPGSLRDGGSYGVITIENGKCSFTWKRVPEF